MFLPVVSTLAPMQPPFRGSTIGTGIAPLLRILELLDPLEEIALLIPHAALSWMIVELFLLLMIGAL